MVSQLVPSPLSMTARMRAAERKPWNELALQGGLVLETGGYF
jgi:hypothetical protein